MTKNKLNINMSNIGKYLNYVKMKSSAGVKG
jgi:hypothetical protein